MSWFNQTLKKLKALLKTLLNNPSKSNFQKFHAEVQLRLEILKKEEENIRWINTYSKRIEEKISSIKDDFEDMLYMSEEEDLDKILNRKRAKEAEIGRYSKKIEALSKSVSAMNEALKKIDLGVKLLRKEEKKLEE